MAESDTPMRFVFVGDDGTFREVRAAANADTLPTLQTLVDGYIELVGTTVPCAGGRRAMDIWLNEEGKMRPDFHANPHALRMLDYSTSDIFVGPAVLSAADDEGETVGLDEELIGAVRRKLLQMGASELPTASVEEAAEQQRQSREARVELGHEGHGDPNCDRGRLRSVQESRSKHRDALLPRLRPRGPLQVALSGAQMSSDSASTNCDCEMM